MGFDLLDGLTGVLVFFFAGGIFSFLGFFVFGNCQTPDL